jgi:RNA-directed DNA polymerase
MTAAQPADAVSHSGLDWQAIDWPKAESEVRRLQERIVKAVKERRWGKVKALQRLLTRSHSGKLLAVRRVTQNSGSKTPGVDRVTWRHLRSKEEAVMSLTARGYRPKPLRRIYIPKSNGKMRPLGIPTMRDRAMQALYLLALEPIAETLADPNSYGFRKGRSCADAIEQCYTVLRGAKDRWILEGDIKSCFDEISHEWLMAYIPMERAILRKWLKCGYMDEDAFHATSHGTPQGGIISPVLANMTLDGLETRLRNEFPTEGPGYREGRKARVHMVRYADDFVVTASNRELLETRVRPIVQEFLHNRGLELSWEKTSIVHITDGFDFLGQNVRAYGRKTLIMPDKRRVKAFLDSIRELVKRNAQTPTDRLIAILNPRIRGWANYHRHVCSKDTFCHVDTAIFRCIWQWARRRHRYPHKSRRWIADRYFGTVGNRSWRFFGDERTKGGKTVRHWLCLAARTPIVRHIKVKAAANPYDPAWNRYFQTRSAPRAKSAKVKPTNIA